MEGKLEHIRSEYDLDKKELGKVMVIASAALLVVSAHAAMEFKSASENIEETNEGFERTSAMINSQSFQESLEALGSVRGTDIAPKFIQAADAFQAAENAMNSSEKAEQNLSDSYNSYRWLVLISIIGIVTGASIRYI